MNAEKPVSMVTSPGDADVEPAPLNVLIAEDDFVLGEYLTIMLERVGCTVSHAPDGKVALGLMREQHFDVLITDWQMPVLDGAGLVRELRANPPGHFVHIIMMTTRTAHRTLRTALEVEVDAFLYKPFDPVELELSIESARRIVALETRLRLKNLRLQDANRRVEEALLRITEDLATAADTQRSILPLPRLSGPIRHAGLYIPSFDLGGDSYGIVDLGDGKAFFFLVDICGHGVQAALRSFLLHHRLVALAPSTPEALVAAAAHLNDLLLSEGGDSYFTIACGIVDRNAGALWLLCAGHPFPLLLEDGQVTPCEEGGPPIGLIPDMAWPVARLALKTGQRLLLYSDGVIDCGRSLEQRFGLSGISAFAAAQGDRPMPEFLAALERRLVADYRDTRGFDDDISLFMIEIG